MSSVLNISHSFYREGKIGIVGDSREAASILKSRNWKKNQSGKWNTGNNNFKVLSL